MKLHVRTILVKQLLQRVVIMALKTVLEIGSWDGTGSTQCFIEGMKEHDNKRLVV